MQEKNAIEISFVTVLPLFYLQSYSYDWVEIDLVVNEIALPNMLSTL